VGAEEMGAVMDSRIHGFKDSWIQGFMDSRIQGFKDSRQAMVRESLSTPTGTCGIPWTMLLCASIGSLA
jgi:hypothetical protein